MPTTTKQPAVYTMASGTGYAYYNPETNRVHQISADFYNNAKKTGVVDGGVGGSLMSDIANKIGAAGTDNNLFTGPIPNLNVAAPAAATSSTSSPTTAAATNPNLNTSVANVPIGGTQYFKQVLNGQTYYMTMPWVGNAPYSYSPISQADYVNGLNQQASDLTALLAKGHTTSNGGFAYNDGNAGPYSGPTPSATAISALQTQAQQAQSGTGIFAQGYRDPAYSKYQTNAPTISEQYFTPEYRATLPQAEQTRLTTLYGAAGGAVTTPTTQQLAQNTPILNTGSAQVPAASVQLPNTVTPPAPTPTPTAAPTTSPTVTPAPTAATVAPAPSGTNAAAGSGFIQPIQPAGATPQAITMPQPAAATPTAIPAATAAPTQIGAGQSITVQPGQNYTLGGNTTTAPAPTPTTSTAPATPAPMTTTSTAPTQVAPGTSTTIQPGQNYTLGGNTTVTPPAATPVATAAPANSATVTPAPMGTTAAATTTPITQPSTYNGVSIVDFLNSQGKPSDFNSRAGLAAQMGIQNYTGTATQNEQLLGMLKAGTAATAAQQAGTGAPTQIQPGTNTTIQPGQQYTTGGTTTTPTPVAGTTPATTQPAASNPPTMSSNNIQKAADIYKQLSDAYGLTDIKAEFERALQAHTDLTNEMNQKIADSNNNPWYSQSVKDREAQRIQNSYMTKLDVLTNQQKLYDSIYQQGIEQAKYLTTATLNQQQDEQALEINALLKQIDLTQQQISAQEKINAAASAIKTQVVDIAGQKVVIDSETGAIIKVLGASAAPKAATTTTSTSSTSNRSL